MLHHRGTRQLDTERLRLTTLTVKNAEEMHNGWARDEDATKYLSWPAHKTVEVTRMVLGDWEKKYLLANYYNWGIFLKGSRKLIGTVSLDGINEYKQTCEIGYVIAKEYWNKGYATEAVRRIIDFGFGEVGFRQIFGFHQLRNFNSGKVLEKAGMRRDGCLPRSRMDNKGHICDLTQYSITRDGWLEIQERKEEKNNEN